MGFSSDIALCYLRWGLWIVAAPRGPSRSQLLLHASVSKRGSIRRRRLVVEASWKGVAPPS